jgi:hypothetical protein
MKLLSRHISLYLLLSFLLAVTPTEFLHGLLGHEDTTCRYHADLAIESRHVHCTILQVQIQQYVSPEKKPLPESCFSFFSYPVPCLSYHPETSVNLSSLRAPPVIC